MAVPLPPRRLGKRERWTAVACALVVCNAIGAHLGMSVSDSVMMAMIGLIGVLVGGDTIRPSGMAPTAPPPSPDDGT